MSSKIICEMCHLPGGIYTAYKLDRSKVTPVCQECKDAIEQHDLDEMTHGVFDKLCHAANGHAPAPDLAQSMLRSIQRQHRYLQNELFIVLWKFFQAYGKLDENGYDARNEWAVQVAKRWDSATFE